MPLCTLHSHAGFKGIQYDFLNVIMVRNLFVYYILIVNHQSEQDGHITALRESKPDTPVPLTTSDLTPPHSHSSPFVLVASD